jgi:hypothetical protein
VVGLFGAVMVGMVALIVVNVATYDGGSDSPPSSESTPTTHPAFPSSRAAYDLELMDGADAARCSWVKGTRTEYDCVFRIGASRARARVGLSTGMDETIGMSGCKLITAGAGHGGGNACNRKRPGG